MLSFETNQGKAEPEVKFLSRGPGYSLALTSTEVQLRLSGSTNHESHPPEDFGMRRAILPAEPLMKTRPLPEPEAVIRMRFVAANPNPPKDEALLET